MVHQCGSIMKLVLPKTELPFALHRGLYTTTVSTPFALHRAL